MIKRSKVVKNCEQNVCLTTKKTTGKVFFLAPHSQFLLSTRSRMILPSLVARFYTLSNYSKLELRRQLPL